MQPLVKSSKPQTTMLSNNSIMATPQLQLSIVRLILTIYRKWKAKCSKCKIQKKKVKWWSTIWKKLKKICWRKLKVWKADFKQLTLTMGFKILLVWPIFHPGAKVKLEVKDQNQICKLTYNKWNSLNLN